MMGVFRINPFTMHCMPGLGETGHGATVQSGGCWEPGPLEEEPIMFEFQLDLFVEGGEDGEESEGDEVEAGDTKQSFAEGARQSRKSAPNRLQN